MQIEIGYVEEFGPPLYGAILAIFLTLMLVLLLNGRGVPKPSHWVAFALVSLVALGVGLGVGAAGKEGRADEKFLAKVEQLGIEKPHLENNVLTGKGTDGEYLEGVVMRNANGLWEIIFK